MSTALDSWLRTHEAETTRLDGYRGYIERTIEPALGAAPVSAITVRLLEKPSVDARPEGAEGPHWMAFGAVR